MYFEVMSSVWGKSHRKLAVSEASLGLFELFCSGFKKDKNFLGRGKRRQTFNQLYNFL